MIIHPSVRSSPWWSNIHFRSKNLLNYCDNRSSFMAVCKFHLFLRSFFFSLAKNHLKVDFALSSLVLRLLRQRRNEFFCFVRNNGRCLCIVLRLYKTGHAFHTDAISTIRPDPIRQKRKSRKTLFLIFFKKIW